MFPSRIKSIEVFASAVKHHNPNVGTIWTEIEILLLEIRSVTESARESSAAVSGQRAEDAGSIDYLRPVGAVGIRAGYLLLWPRGVVFARGESAHGPRKSPP